MTPEMQTVLWITAVGAAVLFGSIGGLVLLMYLLTASWLFPKSERAAIRARRPVRKGFRFARPSKREKPVTAEAESKPDVDAAEHERRLRAVALATAIACAETSDVTWLPATDMSSEWRLLHRARRLGLQPPRMRSPK
jgi:hypothetical protein